MTDFPTPFVSIDVVLLTLRDNELCCLLTRREAEPFAGAWALPGGYVHVDEDETAEATATRVLTTKAGVPGLYVEQLQTFTGRRRDPRGWSVSIAYFALVPHDLFPVTDTENRQWVSVDQVGTLPFDHAQIVQAAVARLRSKALYSTLPVHLIPEYFTLHELQRVYENLLQGTLDPRSFRRRIEDLGALEAVPGMTRQAGHRPAQVYRIKPGMRGTLSLAPKNLEVSPRA